MPCELGKLADGRATSGRKLLQIILHLKPKQSRCYDGVNEGCASAVALFNLRRSTIPATKFKVNGANLHLLLAQTPRSDLRRFAGTEAWAGGRGFPAPQLGAVARTQESWIHDPRAPFRKSAE